MQSAKKKAFLRRIPFKYFSEKYKRKKLKCPAHRTPDGAEPYGFQEMKYFIPSCNFYILKRVF